jgi:hypothetical protein
MAPGVVLRVGESKASRWRCNLLLGARFPASHQSTGSRCGQIVHGEDVIEMMDQGKGGQITRKGNLTAFVGDKEI